MSHRGRGRGGRARLFTAVVAAVGLWSFTMAAESAAAMALASGAAVTVPTAQGATTALSGTLAFGKAGSIRLVVDRARLEGADPRLRLALENEGSEKFTIDYRDAWIIVMRDGRKEAFAPRTYMH